LTVAGAQGQCLLSPIGTARQAALEKSGVKPPHSISFSAR
jgi:hypothetical protein